MSHSQPNFTFTHNLFVGFQTPGTVVSRATPAEIILPGHDAGVTMAVRGNTLREVGLPRPLDLESKNDPFMSDSGVSIAPLLIGAAMMLVMRRHRC